MSDATGKKMTLHITRLVDYVSNTKASKPNLKMGSS